MAKSAVLLSMILHVASMRISVENNLPDTHGREAFTCPSECVECCKALRSLTGLVDGYFQQRNSFKCITRARDNVTSVSSHDCDEPVARTSNSFEMKRTCRFTHPEMRTEPWRQLENCRDTSVRTYEDFLGYDACSLTDPGKLLSRATGARTFGFASAGIDVLFLTNSLASQAGVCHSVSSTFTNGGLAAFAGMTSEEAEAEICSMIQYDLETKRLDRFGMAVWALSVGPLNPWNLTKAEPTQILEKFEIPGWHTRVSAYRAPEDDMKPIDLQGGLLQCAMLRLRGLPIEDDMTDVNNWGHGREDPTVIHHKYYDRWGIYQRPWNFPFPQNEMTSDRILEQLVFQNVGAHRLELLNDLDGHDASSINLVGLGGCGTGALPVIGCPFPLQSALAAVPEHVRRSLKFAVRQEGLFDDVPRRPGLGKWGANAFFDGDGHLRALQYNGRTLVAGAASTHEVAGAGGNDWEYFKFVFRSTLVSSVTAFEHLIGTHILAAETLALAVSENLGPENELRMLLQPHIVGSLSINFAASTNLFAEGILIHRASPFAREAFVGEDGTGTGILWAKAGVLRHMKFEDAYRTYRQHFEELRSEGVQMPELPFFEDGILLFHALQEYVHSAIDKIYGSGYLQCNGYLHADREAMRFLASFWHLTDPSTPDFWPQEFRGSDCNSLKAFLTEIIFMVTGWHRHVGSVADFFRDTRFASTVWKEGETNTRPKQAHLMMLLAATTNAILPKLTLDVAETLYAGNGKLEQNLKMGLYPAMLEIQGQIEQRNQIRQSQNDIPYHQMEPDSVEWGVQV